MKIFKKFMQMTVLLIISLTLHIIPWIPSSLVENIVNFTIIFLYILSAFLVYEIIATLYHEKAIKSIWKNAFYTLLLFCYIGIFAIIKIGVYYEKSTYVSSHVFEEKTFYLYETNDFGYEVSMREEILPMRSLPLVTYAYTSVSLEQRGRSVYTVGAKIDEMVYNFEENKLLTHPKTQN